MALLLPVGCRETDQGMQAGAAWPCSLRIGLAGSGSLLGVICPGRFHLTKVAGFCRLGRDERLATQRAGSHDQPAGGFAWLARHSQP